MTDNDPSQGAVVRQFKPRPDALEATVKSIAIDSDQIDWSIHAFERMDERGIITDDVLRVLRTGSIKGGIEAGKNVGEWKVKMVKVLTGRKECGVVTVLIGGGRLFVKTAEWEDVR